MPRAGTRQANFTLPIELIEELRRSVPQREQSKVVADAVRKELTRLKFRRVLETSFGAWSKEPHPELEKDVEAYIRESRRSTRGEGMAKE